MVDFIVQAFSWLCLVCIGFIICCLILVIKNDKLKEEIERQERKIYKLTLRINNKNDPVRVRTNRTKHR